MTIMNNKTFLIVVYGLLAFLLVFAVALYSYAGEPLTLELAVETAQRSNPGLKAADSQVEAAKAGVLRSYSVFLPKVTLSETYGRTDNPLMVFGNRINREMVGMADFDPAAINDPEPISNFNTRLAVMQPVFNGGKEYLGRRQARLGHEAAVSDRERQRQETVAGVIKAYYGLLLAREYHKVALQSLATSEENVRLAAARFKAGAVLRSDLLGAKVQYAEVKEMATRSESGVRLAKAALNSGMGTAQWTEYDIVGSLAPQDTKGDVNALIEDAVSLRPDLAAMGLNRKNAETGVAMAKSDYMPSLNVMGQADWNSSGLAGDDAKSWAVMAVLQWNLFDGLLTRSKVREALAASARMRALEEQMRSAVHLQVRQAYYTLKATQDRLDATATSAQEAEEGLRIVQKRYEAGMTSFVDVLGAEGALIRARTNALQALYDNNVAQAELKLAVGTL